MDEFVSAESVIQPQLEQGEELVWTGRPRRWAYAFGGSAKAGFFFGVFWTAGTLYFVAWNQLRRLWENGPDSGPLNWFALGFTMLFPVAGVAMIAVPFFRYWRAGRVWYAVTDRRAIEARGNPSSPAIRSWRTPDMLTPEAREQPDSSGSVTFCRERRKGGQTGAKSGFYGVERVRAAAAALSAVIEKGSQAAVAAMAALAAESRGHAADYGVAWSLREGELLIWTGKPVPKAYGWGGIGKKLFQFGVLWTAFSTLFAVLFSVALFMGRVKGDQAVFGLLIAVFECVGVFLLTRPLARAKKARDICFAVSNMRILISSPKRSGADLLSIEPGSMTAPRREARKDGTENLYFWRNPDMRENEKPVEDGFMGVEDADGAMRAIQALYAFRNGAM